MANTEFLEGIRCPVCFEEDRFVIQVTVNALLCDDGYDWMASQPDPDHFPGRVLTEDEGLGDEDPISCANRNGCGHYGTVAEFRIENQDKERETTWRREMQLQYI
ncbi:hypothetical protein ACFVU2_19190 [Leifsonia sp. NPDC058194]|uniref:hypothetical protein n=1 Tax=Leifsonia sp. NPDC058194 TaxID=3346374 RepID=UPI0036D7EA32